MAKFSKRIEGNGFNEVYVETTNENEIGLGCTEASSESCYVCLDIGKAKELVIAINEAISSL